MINYTRFIFVPYIYIEAYNRLLFDFLFVDGLVCYCFGALSEGL